MQNAYFTIEIENDHFILKSEPKNNEFRQMCDEIFCEKMIENIEENL